MSTEIRFPLGDWGGSLYMEAWEQQPRTGNLRDLDAQTLAGVYDRYSEAVYKYVRYRLNDDGVAEDVTSQVFLNLLEALDRGGGPETNVKAWLLSTAGHLVTDHIRRSYRRPTEALGDDHPDTEPAPSEEVERREQARNFRRAYAQLTPEQQHVLALRFGQGLSLEDTAAVISKKVNAVKALQFRAMQALQRRIGADGDALT